MDFAASLFVAVSLAMDAFAVSLGVGTAGSAPGFRSKFRLAFHFGIFQSLMTFLGWLMGSTIATFISTFDHWVAMVLLGIVGVNMIRSGLNADKESFIGDPSRGKTLVMLSVATSLDAMAVGLSMAMVSNAVLMPVLLIGVVTLTLSSIGLLTGTRLGERFGKKMEIIGGAILLFIGLRILFTHLF